MSDFELLAVVACVATVCSTYHDGAELLQQIKAKRKAQKALLQVVPSQTVFTADLETSLSRGEGVVRSQYDRDFKRYGALFAHGDQIARDALKDIIVHLQNQVIASLKVQWQQDINVDFAALQDVSDASQDRAILVLMQLQQRIITTAPIEDLRPPPLFSFATSEYQSASVSEKTSQAISPSSEISAQRFPAPPAYRPPAFQAHQPAFAPFHTADPSSERKTRFASVAKISIFSRRSKSDHSANEFQDHLSKAKTTTSDQEKRIHQADQAKEKRHSVAEHPKPSTRLSGLGNESSSACCTEPQTPELNPWAYPRRSSPPPTARLSVSSTSQYSRSIGTLATMPSTVSGTHISVNPRDLLPGEANKYAGFCKGAWRLQIGDKKKAMVERQRQGGLYSAANYWQCSKCKFEGRLVILDRRRKGYDTRVMMSEGVQFRWEFLFKSHFESKDTLPDPLRATFGCIFCCAEGRGTPTFGGIQAFVAHLQEHRDRLPRGEVLYRMNCLVGRRAGQDEDFDVNLVGTFVEDS